MINNTIRNLTSFKRQIEILTLFYPELRIQNCKIEDLAYKFNVSVPTINRDLPHLSKTLKIKRVKLAPDILK